MVDNLLGNLVPVRLRRGLRQRINRIRHFGGRNECPFCGARLRSFLPFGLHSEVLARERVVGGGRRLNARCPVCESIDRERLLWLYLKHRTDVLAQSLRLLHVAPEQPIRAQLQDRANIAYLSADLDDDDVMVNMDITRIAYPDGSFDAVICNHVLEHIIDDATAMSELHRVLKPGGWAILQVPISLRLARTFENAALTTPGEREMAFGQSDHVRIYAGDYAERLQRAGFAVEKFFWTREGAEFGVDGNRYGLNPDECVHVARKPAA